MKKLFNICIIIEKQQDTTQLIISMTVTACIFSVLIYCANILCHYYTIIVYVSILYTVMRHAFCFLILVHVQSEVIQWHTGHQC